MGWVDDEFTIDATYANGTNRASEGDVREAKGSRGTVHREDVGVIDAIGTEEQGDDLCFVEVALGEQRTQGTVGHAAGENFLFGRAAFAFEVATGKYARSRGFLFVFHREGEPSLASFYFGCGYSGDEDDGVSAADGDGTVGEFGKFAGFDNHGIGSHFNGNIVYVHVCLFSFFVESLQHGAAGGVC